LGGNLGLLSWGVDFAVESVLPDLSQRTRQDGARASVVPTRRKTATSGAASVWCCMGGPASRSKTKA